MYPSFGSISHHRILCGFGHSMAKIMPCTEAALAIEMKLVCNKTRKPLFWMDPDLPPWETGVRYYAKANSKIPAFDPDLPPWETGVRYLRTGRLSKRRLDPDLPPWETGVRYFEEERHICHSLDPDLPPWETGVRYLVVSMPAINA